MQTKTEGILLEQIVKCDPKKVAQAITGIFNVVQLEKPHIQLLAIAGAIVILIDHYDMSLSTLCNVVSNYIKEKPIRSQYKGIRQFLKDDNQIASMYGY